MYITNQGDRRVLGYYWGNLLIFDGRWLSNGLPIIAKLTTKLKPGNDGEAQISGLTLGHTGNSVKILRYQFVVELYGRIVMCVEVFGEKGLVDEPEAEEEKDQNTGQAGKATQKGVYGRENHSPDAISLRVKNTVGKGG
jgi:hypothetical protein